MVRALINASIFLVNLKHDLVIEYDRKIKRYFKKIQTLEYKLLSLRRKACVAEVNNNQRSILKITRQILRIRNKHRLIVSKMIILNSRRNKESSDSFNEYINDHNIYSNLFGIE